MTNAKNRRSILASDDDLVAALALAVDEVGRTRFLEGTVVEPQPAFFPPWTADVTGVEGVLNALLGHAGLEAVRAIASTEREELGETDAEPAQSSHPGSCVWLSAVEHDIWMFGVDLGRLDDVAGTASHEIAHALRLSNDGDEAKRSTYRINARAPDIVSDEAHHAREEIRVQAVEICLGFGLLAVNHSLAAGNLVSPMLSELGGTVRMGAFTTGGAGRHARADHLSPEGTCFLAAAQLVARGTSRDEISRKASLLHDDQREIFLGAIRKVTRKRDEIMRSLGLAGG